MNNPNKLATAVVAGAFVALSVATAFGAPVNPFQITAGRSAYQPPYQTMVDPADAQSMAKWVGALTSSEKREMDNRCGTIRSSPDSSSVDSVALCAAYALAVVGNGPDRTENS